MLQRLKVHRFRNVRPGTELAFSEHMNVLLGRNGTGKTTLLDLISVVLRSDFARLRGEEFDLEYALQDELGRTEVRLQNSAVAAMVPGDGRRTFEAKLTLSVELAASEGAKRFVLVANSTALRWQAEAEPSVYRPPTDLLVEDGLLNAISHAFVGSAGASSAINFLSHHRSRAHASWRFDESLNTYEAIVRADYKSGSLALAPPIEAEMKFINAPLPMVVQRLQRFLPVSLVVSPPEHGQASARVEVLRDLPRNQLARFPEITGLRDISMSLAVQGSRREDDGEWWRFGPASFQFTLPDGTTFSHEGLSYGQKRLLAFLYYLSANEAYVVADELVNGMHHEWIRFCVDELQSRQCFLTSQNPLLLDYIPLGTPDEIRKTFIQCRAELAGGRSRFVWANLTEDDAGEIAKDLAVGVQQVGEILRVRGLW